MTYPRKRDVRVVVGKDDPLDARESARAQRLGHVKGAGRLASLARITSDPGVAPERRVDRRFDDPVEVLPALPQKRTRVLGIARLAVRDNDRVDGAIQPRLKHAIVESAVCRAVHVDDDGDRGKVGADRRARFCPRRCVRRHRGQGAECDDGTRRRRRQGP